MDYAANGSNLANGSEASNLLATFWPRITKEIQNMTSNDFKNVELPLARIKKIMKLDDEVKMISAEAPIIFAKAAEIFIQELTIRAWIHTEENKRRTLQRNDTALAISKFDQFDFLIDIVPREEIKPPTTKKENTAMTSPTTLLNTTSPLAGQVSNVTDGNNVQYFVMQNGNMLQLQGLQGLTGIQGIPGAQIIQLAGNPQGGGGMVGNQIISLVSNNE